MTIPQTGPAPTAEPTATADMVTFDRVLDAQRRRLYGIAYAVLRNPAEAEDALQDALLKAWRAWPGLSDRGAAEAWLTRICINQCIDHRRRLILRRAEPADESHHAPVRRVAESLMDLDRAFATLSRRQRAVMTLHSHFGYSIDECAALLDCGAGSVRTHIARAMEKLRKEMAS